MKRSDDKDFTRPSASVDEELLTPKEAADFLKLSDSFLAKKRMTGGGPIYINLGRSVRYSKAALLNWLKSRERRSTKDELDRETEKEAVTIIPEVVD